MNLPDISDRLEKLPHEIQQAGEQYAKDKSNYELLNDLKSVRKSDLMCQVAAAAKQSGENLAEWKIRAMAETHEGRYEKFLRELKTAQGQMLISYARFKAKQAEFDAIRSLSALERAQTSNL